MMTTPAIMKNIDTNTAAVVCFCKKKIPKKKRSEVVVYTRDEGCETSSIQLITLLSIFHLRGIYSQHYYFETSIKSYKSPFTSPFTLMFQKHILHIKVFNNYVSLYKFCIWKIFNNYVSQILAIMFHKHILHIKGF